MAKTSSNKKKTHTHSHTKHPTLFFSPLISVPPPAKKKASRSRPHSPARSSTYKKKKKSRHQNHQRGSRYIKIHNLSPSATFSLHFASTHKKKHLKVMQVSSLHGYTHTQKKAQVYLHMGHLRLVRLPPYTGSDDSSRLFFSLAAAVVDASPPVSSPSIYGGAQRPRL